MKFIPGDQYGGISAKDQEAELAMKRYGWTTLEEVKTGKTPITLWYKQVLQDGQKVWEYNHYALGWLDDVLPAPKHPDQKKVWGSGKWTKAHAMMYYGTIVEVQELK